MIAPVLTPMVFPRVTPHGIVAPRPVAFTELVVAYDSSEYWYFKTPARAWSGSAYICLPRKTCGIAEPGGYRVWLTLGQVDRYADWLCERVSE